MRVPDNILERTHSELDDDAEVTERVVMALNIVLPICLNDLDRKRCTLTMCG